jgi:hypothetical protein
VVSAADPYAEPATEQVSDNGDDVTGPQSTCCQQVPVTIAARVVASHRKPGQRTSCTGVSSNRRPSAST